MMGWPGVGKTVKGGKEFEVGDGAEGRVRVGRKNYNGHYL